MPFDENQPRDEIGQWTSGDAGDAIKKAASDKQPDSRFLYQGTETDLTLYRGDTRDKGAEFKDNMHDYIFDGDVKNKANFHFFTDDKKLATKYATEEMNSKGRINENNPHLTTVNVKGNLLDLHTKIKTYGDLNKALYGGKMTSEQYVMLATGGLTRDKYLEQKAYPKMEKETLPGAAHLSNGKLGIKFKETLIKNGYDGYVFYEGGLNFAVVDKNKIKVKNREKINQGQ